MNRDRALKQFQREVAPVVLAKYGKNDRPACREAWNNWIDGLQKDGQITRQQSETWIGPKSCRLSARRRSR
jgi:ABC-type amino acid transport substrate-binding protein